MVLKKELEDARKTADLLKNELKKVQEKFQEKEWNLCEICVSPYQQGVADKTPKFLGELVPVSVVATQLSFQSVVTPSARDA